MRVVWIPELERAGGWYRSREFHVTAGIPPGPLTDRADAAMQFRTRSACEAWCRRHHGFVAREHAFYD